MATDIRLSVEPAGDLFRLLAVELRAEGYRKVVEIFEFEPKHVAFVARTLEQKFSHYAGFSWDDTNPSPRRALITEIKNKVKELQA